MKAKPPLPRLDRRPLVVASLADYRRLAADARAAARAGAGVLEVRADHFPRSALRPATLREALLKVRRAARRPLIFTLRSRAEGGRLPHGLSEQDRLRLFRAALSRAELVDVELSANDINHHVVWEAHKRGRAAILSAHDFKRMPSDAALGALARKASRLGGDVLKVAAQARRAADAERFMAFCGRSGFPYRAFLVMGPLGRESRREGFRWKSCLTYGYVRRPVAPGQLSVRELAQASRPYPGRAGA